jgi:hypothetical protein
VKQRLLGVRASILFSLRVFLPSFLFWSAFQPANWKSQRKFLATMSILASLWRKQLVAVLMLISRPAMQSPFASAALTESTLVR